MTKPKVEMHHAWEWTCDDCGRNNFVSAIVAEFSEDDRLETARRLGVVDEFCTEIPEDLTGDFMTFPTEVKCDHCGSEFESEHDEVE